MDALSFLLGTKAGSGGGSGTTVVANPEGEATDILEKLQVGDDIYAVSSDDTYVLDLDTFGDNTLLDMFNTFTTSLFQYYTTTQQDYYYVQLPIDSLDFDKLQNIVIKFQYATPGSIPTYPIEYSLSKKYNSSDTSKFFQFLYECHDELNHIPAQAPTTYSIDAHIYISGDTYELGLRLEGIHRIGAELRSVSASTWVSDNTYADFGYKCVLNFSEITPNSVVEVIYDMTEAISGNYAPICIPGHGSVTIYSKVNTAITIPIVKEII